MADLLPVFDLNEPAPEDDDDNVGIDLNEPQDDDGVDEVDIDEPPLENGNGNAFVFLLHSMHLISMNLISFPSHFLSLFLDRI